MEKYTITLTAQELITLSKMIDYSNGYDGEPEVQNHIKHLIFTQPPVAEAIAAQYPNSDWAQDPTLQEALDHHKYGPATHDPEDDEANERYFDQHYH